MTKPTEVEVFINDCDGGVFAGQLAKILSEAAMSAVTHSRQADVTVKFSMKRIEESQQVSIKHKLSYSMPTIPKATSAPAQAVWIASAPLLLKAMLLDFSLPARRMKTWTNTPLMSA